MIKNKPTEAAPSMQRIEQKMRKYKQLPFQSGN